MQKYLLAILAGVGLALQACYLLVTQPLLAAQTATIDCGLSS